MQLGAEKMFNKSTFFSHLSNTPESTIQEQGSPIMQSERGKFGIAGRGATNIAASTPAAVELRTNQEAEKDVRVAARRQFEKDEGMYGAEPTADDSTADNVRNRYNTATGKYEPVLSDASKQSLVQHYAAHLAIHTNPNH